MKYTTFKSNHFSQIPRNLFLLFVIFILGIGAQALLNQSFSRYTSELDQTVRNAEIENLLGQQIIIEIHKIETAFYELSGFPNKHMRKIIQQEILTREQELAHLLEILNSGGSYKHRIDLNLPNTSEQYETLYYKPVKTNSFSFAQADILPKISIINQKLEVVSNKLLQMDIYRKNLDPKLYAAIESYKLDIKLLKPLFHRIKEDANRIFFRNKNNFQSIRLQVEKQKSFYRNLQVSLTLTLIILGLLAFWRLSRNIRIATTELESSKEYTQDILDSQSNIIIVNDGQSIIDVSGGFFNYFSDYKSLKDFSNDFDCICDLFIKEEGYIWNFKDKSWIHYILENPHITHKVKLQYKNKVTIFQITASQSQRYERFIISMFDITALEKIRSDIEEQKNRALEATRSKGEFLANMSHEIRTPLNAILGFISLLKEKDHDKETCHYLDTIDSSSHSLLSIINDILDLSKIESGKLHLDYSDFNPTKEFNNIAELFKARCSEKHLNFIITLDDKLPEGIRSDALRIKQVIANLLSNAIKFTEPDKNIELQVFYQTGNLTIKVIDEGIGMTPEAQKKVFEAFSQAEGSTTRKYGGTGLGLTISTKLVQMLGGQLRVQSEPGKGSQFYFTIPVKEVAFKETSPQRSLTNQKFCGTILLVEDNKTNQMLMTAILKKLGLEFDIANDGLEAIDSLRKKQYDLVLMDENMPNLNGIEATKRIRQQEHDNDGERLPIIALTANAMTGDRERFIEAGMDEYLSKPINLQELNKVLSTFLKIQSS